MKCREKKLQLQHDLLFDFYNSKKQLKKESGEIMKAFKTIWQKHRNFLIYLIVGVGISLTNIALLYILIDIIGFSTLLSGTIVVGGLFILKYFLYKWTGFTQ